MKRFFAGLTIIAVFCLGALLVGRRPEGGIKEQTSSPPTPTSSNLANAIRSASNAAAPLLNPVLTNKLPAAERSAPFPAIDAFSTWADQYLSPTGAVSLVRGQELAWKRRQAMAELIESNPEQAIAMAVPFAWRAALPANVTKYFETRLDGRGDFNVGVATDFEHGTTAIYREARLKGKRYTAFVFGARNNQSSQTNIPLHGIELGGRVALQPEPIRILEAAESEALVKESGQPVDPICAVSGNPANSRNQPVAAEIGGEVRYFCGLDHIRLLNQKPALAASGGVGGTNTFSTPANDAWTHGPKALLYMRVNFPDDLTEPISEAQAYNVMDGVNDFYTTGSYDLTALTATVTPLITLPQTKNYYSSFGPGSLLDDARETVRRNGYDTANYDRDIVCFTSVPGYTFGGLAFVHGKGVWLQSTGVGVTSHELGHNYGLWHANAWNPTNLSVIGPGTNNEYGNIFDTMGSGGVAQFNSAHKNLLDWLPTEDVHNAASNGVYRIYPFDVPNRVNGRAYAAFVRKDSLRDYWIEFRESYTANRWLQNGVLLDWSPWLESNGGTHLLDTTPGTPNGLDDAAVVIGRTFTDPGAGVHITPVGKGATGTNAWIEVQVNHGGPTNNQPPSLSLQIEFTNAAPGQVVHFHAAATDPDGDTLAYAFSFDDSTFSTNNLPWTYKSWSTPGNHVVRCVVSDMKGGVASANGIVRVGNPSGFSIRGQILNADGNPIEGVRVDNTLTNGTYYGGYTDSDGSYVITGASGDLPLYPVLHGFTFTNITWTNPVSATADVLHADFIASPLPQVNIVSSTNAVPENSTGSNYFLLTRTGDPITNLTLTIYLSGSATVGNDYTLNPPLVAGSNSIDIPPGEQSLAISFTPINDSLVEGPESVTIMVMEDPAYLYVPAYPSEAAITILDDDSPTKPAVSITAVTPTVPENGIDKATFQVSRNGSAQGDLMVFYTVSGTATPGQDYTSLVGGVLIPSGSSSALVQFQPIDDKLVEGDETVIVSLSSNPAYTPGSSSSDQIKILDDDLLTVTISPTSDSAAEPSNPGRFTVMRQGDLTANVVVNYTVSGTANSGTDFVALPGSITVPAGAASVDFLLQPIDDLLLEGDESVLVTLSTNIGYNVGTPGSATLFIHDNEKPTLSISATVDTVSEEGDTFGEIQISRGSSVNGALTVNLAISGSATPGGDYLPLDNTAVIPNGATSVTLDIIPFDDLHVETNETVIVTILPSTNYNGGGSATVTITDEDSNSVPAVGFTFTTSSAAESLSPGVIVGLSFTSAVPIMVDYKVIGGTASNTDYTLPQGTLTFQPGDLFATIPLQIHDNSIAQPDRTIRLVLFNPINGTLDYYRTHTCTILDDDSGSISVAATVPTASETGPVPGNFRISRAGATNAALTVNFQVTGTASAPTDYSPLGTSVPIPVGATFVDLPVIPVNDPTVEHGETVVLTLTTAPTAKIVSPNAATVTITDNDTSTLPVVTVTSTNHPNAVEGGANGEFLLTRNTTNGPLVLRFSLTGTAINGVDYVFLTNVITIPDGQTSVTLAVIAIDDGIVEPEETVVLALMVSDTYLAAYPSSAIVTVQDNDQTLRVDASDFLAAEPGTDTGEFTFTRFGTTNDDLRVFFTISGTASNGVDYVFISNSVIIPAGSLSCKLPVIPIDDLVVEGPETVVLTLATNSAYTLSTGINATVTIMDDEPMLVLVSTVSNIVEGSQEPAVFRLIRSGDPKYEFNAGIAVGGTATFAVDYPPFATNVHFSCGITGIDLLIYPTNELIIEPNETVTAALIGNPAYTILSPSNASLTIIDGGTNQTPLVSITSPTVPMVFLSNPNVNIILEASLLDDSDTNNPISLTWTNMTGATNFAFGNTNEAITTASFTNAGIYVLRLTADDGQLQGFAQVSAVVAPDILFSTNLLHWAFDETSGTIAADTSGSGRNGALTGTPVWVTNGVLGGALRLAGTNDCVRLGSATNLLEGRRMFTLSLWVNSAVSNKDQGILCADESGTNATLAISTRLNASCGDSTNVIEVTVPTSTGVAHYTSASNALTNGWQHLALTWSNGLAPGLYLNGHRDQPLFHAVAWAGFLTNCPEFVVGRCPAATTNSWNGLVDDVRVFARALNDTEVAALASIPPANYGAIVDAGTNVTTPRTFPWTLAGNVTDDGHPNPPGALSNLWLLVDGPAPVTFTNANSLTNTINFTDDGEYVFRLIGDDGQVMVFQDITNTVIEPTRVDVLASDSDAAELGPDTGEFTFTRDGDTNFEMQVYLAMSGTASNGFDFPALTNVVVFPAGQDTVKWLLAPYLDHRIEGDETFTLTIISNIAYSIGNSPATITIHDSPYGQWSVQRFTLEELTLPNLSSEGADFDHDGYVNLVEYAENRDPRSAETNAPLATAIELDANDHTNHITLTFTRRLEPTDVSYAVYVSNDLFNWHTDSDWVEELSATDDGNGLTETVKAEVKPAYASANPWFITVRVWLRVTGP